MINNTNNINRETFTNLNQKIIPSISLIPKCSEVCEPRIGLSYFLECLEIYWFVKSINRKYSAFFIVDTDDHDSKEKESNKSKVQEHDVNYVRKIEKNDNILEQELDAI